MTSADITIRDDWGCEESEIKREAGLDPGRSFALRYGVPILALAMLAATLIVALADRTAFHPLAFVLLIAAAYPWLRWLLIRDDGPTWTFLAQALAPIAALGIGQWFYDPLSLASSLGYHLTGFQNLLIVVLVIAYAEARPAVTTAAVANFAYAGPFLAAWIAGKGVSGELIVSWHMALILALVAGYAVRMSYESNRAVIAAREQLAWQQAAEERRRIARDVHDVVAHTLAVTMLHVTAARMAVKRSEPGAAEEALEEAERQGRTSLADVRRIVRLLRADDAGELDAAQPSLSDVDALIEGYRQAGLPVAFTGRIEASSLSANAELALFRVLQEALTNAARHGAGETAIELRGDRNGISLRIENQLRQPPARRNPGSGLIGMKERIAAAGGSLDAGAVNGRWVVNALLPAGAAR
jgi:signal transduction histidine kinase